MEKQRLLKFRQLMGDRDLPAMLITGEHNRRYLSGFTGSAGVLLITPQEAYLITDFRYRTQAPQQAVEYKIVEHGPKLTDTIKELADKEGVKRLGFEGQDVTYAAYAAYSSALSGIELISTDGLVEQLRHVKDAEELKIIQEAADLADQTFTHLLSFIRPGLSELQVALEIEFFMRKNGAASSSFDTIVASGERSALPHGVASERIIGSDEFVKLDFGAYYKGYCSDITRTVIVGKPSAKHKEIYDIVLEANLAGIQGLKAGMTGRQGDALARDVIAKYGYADHFGHGTGHGIGMEIHEAPRLSKQSDQVLVPGMVVTVEPGIYIPGFGGVRIEDDVVIEQEGVRVLTNSPKQLIAVD